MNYLSSIFEQTGKISITQILLCILLALVVGCIIAGVYMIHTKYTASFVVTLAMLPAIVCVVIMMVDGNVGAGVAVAGAFSLVRFRSVPGTAKEIGTIFMAMGAGLILGMGYLTFALIFTVIMCLAMFLLGALVSKIKACEKQEKVLRITVPEDINYGSVFDDIFDKFTNKCEVVSVKTTNMGSMYKLVFNVVLKDASKEKEFIDELRCRNGNLEINISRAEAVSVMEL